MKTQTAVPKLAFAWFICILTAFSHGADTLLQKYVNIALQNNPALQAIQKKHEAAEKKVAGAGTLNYPQLDIGFYTGKEEIEMNGIVGNVSLMQMFNWPGTRNIFQNEARAMAKMQAATLNKAKDSLVALVKVNWHDLCLVNLKIKYMQENLDLMKQMESLASAEFTAGKGLADLLNVQEEILEMNYEIEAMKLELASLNTAFNAMLNVPQSSEILLADTITLHTFDFEKNSEPPMISMIGAENEIFKAQREMNRIMGYPMFGLGVQYKKEMERGMFMAMASFTLPVWRAKTNAALLENELLAEASQKTMMDAKNNLEAERTMARSNLQNLSKKITLYRQQKELAESSQKIALQNFSANRGMFSDILQINRKLLDYRVKELEAMAEYNKTAAQAEVLF
ncbi:MAG: TolC family protein [Candidatus Fibromonas sp.]|jgi:outer membrane protein TolC|nr:TolC family protein [Candidatus Fibromonas sp.]